MHTACACLLHAALLSTAPPLLLSVSDAPSPSSCSLSSSSLDCLSSSGLDCYCRAVKASCQRQVAGTGCMLSFPGNFGSLTASLQVCHQEHGISKPLNRRVDFFTNSPPPPCWTVRQKSPSLESRKKAAVHNNVAARYVECFSMVPQCPKQTHLNSIQVRGFMDWDGYI